MWFETHAHLSDPKFDLDRDQVVQTAIQNKVQTIVEIADGPEEWEKAQQLAEKHQKNLFWAAGLHPYFADQASQENLRRLKDLSQHPLFLAIGEVGLDYFKCEIPRETQKKTLHQTISLALEVKKPLIIHCRNAYEDLIPLLKTYFQTSGEENPLSPGVVHCFSGSIEEAQEIVEMGFFIGVDGPLTYPNAQPLRSVIKSIPIERIVLETDSPYLPPQPYRGQRNEPQYLPLIGEKLAECKGLALSEMQKTLLQTSEKLFRLK